MSSPTTIKIIFFITKRPDISNDDFNRLYAAHNKTIAQIPNLLRYTQNVVLDIPAGPLPGLPVSGVAELWFENAEKMEAGFQSEKGQQLWKIALEELAAFIDMKTLQMSIVQENPVVG